MKTSQGPRMHAKTILALGVAWCAAAHAAEPTGTAVEYFNTNTRHYFVTASPGDMQYVEAGNAGPGWLRTGGQFGVFRNPTDAPNLVPVCRFYAAGPNSHFYALPGDCEAVKQMPGWAYEGIAYYVQPASNELCAGDTTAVYRIYNNGAARNDSNHRFTIDPTVYAKAASLGHAPEGVVMCGQLSADDKRADAVRLMRQATFGASPALVDRAAAIGANAWVDEQLALTPTQYPSYAWVPDARPTACVDDRTLPLRADSYCNRDNYTLFPLQVEFFRNALTVQDQLRARVAFALSQIMVTSGVSVSRNYAMRHYQQLIYDKSLGNFYDLLLAVTLSPMMGDYLDMVNNNKSDPTRGTDPNENYAREILQLFSVGTYLLNQDGTQQYDSAGRLKVSYELAEIKGFSRVFTGWTYPTVAGAQARSNNPRNYLGDMRAVDLYHEFGTKVLLRGTVAPANMTMQQDLEYAHRNIFEHPNVGPFIGKQLIQKLVTSDPSPGYVARVSAVFANNGVGQRGDLRAVVRAILLDPEARGARKIDPNYGKLIEPVLFMTSVARAAGATSDGVALRGSSQNLGQFVFYPASVFNYYPFDYVVPGTQVLGPEFGVQTSTAAINRANFANQVVFSASIPLDQTVYGSTGTQFDLSRYQAAAGDAGALTTLVDRDLLNSTMSTAMRSAIVTAVNAVSSGDSLNRARTALYLVLTSPQYQVQR